MRKKYIDWLRIICILYLLPFHTARIFDANEANYIQGKPNAFCTTLINSSLWFMPLMFLLAGMSCYFSLKKRSNKNYLKERFLRLFIPLIFGIIIFLPPEGYFAYKFHFNSTLSFIAYLKKFFLDFSDLTGYHGSFTPGALWFILYLFIISLITLPIIKKLPTHNIRLFKVPFKILLICIPITIVSALPSIAGKNIFVYGIYVVLGFLIASDDSILDMLQNHKSFYLMCSIAGYIIIFIEINSIGWQQGFNLLGIIFSLIYYFTIWVSLLTFIGYGKQYLNFEPSFLSYFSHASFTIYIVHQTYIVIFAYFILKLTKTFIIQYIIIIFLALTASLITYEVLKRFKIFRFMLGIKS